MNFVDQPASLLSLQEGEIWLVGARVIRLVEHDDHSSPAVWQELNLSKANDDPLLILGQRLRQGGEKVEEILARRTPEEVTYEVVAVEAGDAQRVPSVSAGKDLA